MKDSIDLSKFQNPIIRIHEAGVPTGTARTKGHGNPGYISIVICEKENFKTMNSKHEKLWGSSIFRRDYGTLRGHCAKVREHAFDLARGFSKEYGLQIK